MTCRRFARLLQSSGLTSIQQTAQLGPRMTVVIMGRATVSWALEKGQVEPEF
jgi:hypothetical protein